MHGFFNRPPRMKDFLFRLLLFRFQPVIIQQVVRQSDDMAGGTLDIHRIPLAPFHVFLVLQQSGVFTDSAERRTQVVAQKLIQELAGSHAKCFRDLQHHPVCLSLSDVTMYKNVEYHYQQDSGNSYKEDDAKRFFP